ncbi:MAG: hypothetical protein ATN35_10855 [Epulopiscium sp. Nele67-Bin004]|nr:MAG: hypothetical protein ATN35_10855 [Epulopiscium sp. Nele67-Bin004]
MINVLDDLKVLAVGGNTFYRKQDSLCIILGIGCKYYIRHLGNNIISIDSSKKLDAKHLTLTATTQKYYKYETTINDVLLNKAYHIDRLQNISDGFGVFPTEDGVFKSYIVQCIELILPSLKEILQIDDLEYVGEITDSTYGGKNTSSKDIQLDKLLEFYSKKLGGIILQINIEMQNDRRPNEIDRELVYVSRIFGEYTPTSTEKSKAMIYNIENKKARCVWFYVGNTNKYAPPEYKGLPIVTKEIREQQTKRILDHLQIVSIFMANADQLKRKYKHTKKFIEFLLDPSHCINASDKELTAFSKGFEQVIQGKGDIGMSALEAIYEREIIEKEHKITLTELKKLDDKCKELNETNNELSEANNELSEANNELSEEIRLLKDKLKKYESNSK